jgi:predicted nucleotidyltransferase
MAAPNLKTPTTITGKTDGYAVTTTLAAALSNGAASGKVLKVNSVYCANVDGTAAADIDLTYYNGTTDFYLAKTIAVPADATQVLVTKEAPIYLEEGDSLRAKASTASDLELVISYEDIS